jgi:hypothetical protein
MRAPLPSVSSLFLRTCRSRGTQAMYLSPHSSRDFVPVAARDLIPRRPLPVQNMPTILLAFEVYIVINGSVQPFARPNLRRKLSLCFDAHLRLCIDKDRVTTYRTIVLYFMHKWIVARSSFSTIISLIHSRMTSLKVIMKF